MNGTSDIPPDQDARLKSLAIWHADIQLALSYLTFLHEEVEDDKTYNHVELRRFKAFETAFIVSYGRAFSKSYGLKPNRLTIDQINVAFADSEMKLHEKIRSIRDQVYAHSDLMAAHVRLDIFEEDIHGKPFIIPHVQFEQGLMLDGWNERDNAIEICRKLIYGIAFSIRALASARGDKTAIYLRPEKEF